MKLVERRISATIAAADIGHARPFPDDSALETAADDVNDALEMALSAVVENLKPRFPNIFFKVEPS
jgi:hypothetical protein